MPAREVRGRVLDFDGPVAGATLRLKGTSIATLSAADGSFVLGNLAARYPLRLAAWAEGYYIAGVDVFPWSGEVRLNLAPLPAEDNHHYAWIPPAREDRSPLAEALIRAATSLAPHLPNALAQSILDGLPLACADCHREIYAEWRSSAHASAAINPRLLNLYNGTDAQGRPQVPPGYRLDFPDSLGNCATCHAPAAGLRAPYLIDLNQLAGAEAQGVFCDYCHKIQQVVLDPANGLPPEAMPGAMSVQLLRPPGNRQVIFGSLDDVDRGADSFSALQESSQVCAACHSGSFWGAPIYTSYGEWLASPYPALGVQCQNCHMAPSGMANLAPGRGGLQRDPSQLAGHALPGASDPELLARAAQLEADVHRQGDVLRVTVRVTNLGAGHHLPTDQPMRHLILVVHTRDAQGAPLPYLDREVIPAWGGVYAGLPGKIFARILQDLQSGEAPTATYWRPTEVVSDNRIPAGQSDVSSYEFRAPSRGEVIVEVSLIYRPAFAGLAQAKGWALRDTLLAHQQIRLAE